MRNAAGKFSRQVERDWHLLLLGVLVVFALCAWLFWLFVGGTWARDRLAEQVRVKQGSSLPAVTASQPRAIVQPENSHYEPHNVAAESASWRERAFAELGQTGDSFGSLNALLTAMAGALVAWAGALQFATLKVARREAEHERERRRREAFESLFFRLLEMGASVTKAISTPAPSTDVSVAGEEDAENARHHGTRALASMADGIFKRVPLDRNVSQAMMVERLVVHYVRVVYDARPSMLGPYFRLLFQTFKHVADADPDEMSGTERVRYANIARGQIPEGAVLLLAINALTPEGHRFIPLIEKFGLLEHMHRRHRREYETTLRYCYRPTAFLGSVARAQSVDLGVEPLLREDEFLLAISAARAEDDALRDQKQGWRRAKALKDTDEGI
jgi:hypothetical protein